MNNSQHPNDAADRSLAQATRTHRYLSLDIPLWKALVAGGFLVGITALATLTATHKRAVTENGIAFVNGYLSGVQDGLLESILDGLL